MRSRRSQSAAAIGAVSTLPASTRRPSAARRSTTARRDIRLVLVVNRNGTPRARSASTVAAAAGTSASPS